MDNSFGSVTFSLARSVARMRSRFAKMLGVETDRKRELYLELSRGATLFDLVFWLQILFSAGIATLGLVMNSVAVIIGAMLISPLMGPILGGGLALASGDMVLGLRAFTKIVLSCLLAVAFAVVLVVLLPFREMTSEIAARTQPNTLDLIIALFSGSVGSIAVCRDVKGVATSIPGVAIAVALMPPLCVAGYGLGLILTLDATTGWRIASGGGLLFLTNLVAITFTAMIVFLVVRMSTQEVKERAEEWEHDDPESSFILSVIQSFPRLEQAREIRSLPIRFAMILLPLAVILIPLSQTFNQLRAEINRETRTNELQREVLALWQTHFQNKRDGATRSTVDNLNVIEKDGTLRVDLRVFDDEPYTTKEKGEFASILASKFSRPVESIKLQLVEIPTTSVLSSLRERQRDGSGGDIGAVQARLWTLIDSALDQVALPPNATLVGRSLVMDGDQKLHINLTYLNDTNIDPTIEKTVIDHVQANLRPADTSVNLERVPVDIGLLQFPQRSSTVTVLGMVQLDFVGRMMRENPSLVLAVSSEPGNTARNVENDRVKSISDYLATRWQIQADRIEAPDDSKRGGRMLLQFRLAAPPAENATTANSDQSN